MDAVSTYRRFWGWDMAALPPRHVALDESVPLFSDDDSDDGTERKRSGTPVPLDAGDAELARDLLINTTRGRSAADVAASLRRALARLHLHPSDGVPVAPLTVGDLAPRRTKWHRDDDGAWRTAPFAFGGSTFQWEAAADPRAPQRKPPPGAEVTVRLPPRRAPPPRPEPSPRKEATRPPPPRAPQQVWGQEEVPRLPILPIPDCKMRIENLLCNETAVGYVAANFACAYCHRPIAVHDHV